MGSPDALSNITVFIKAALATRVDERDLIVGNHDLITEIQDALVKGAQGMYGALL